MTAKINCPFCDGAAVHEIRSTTYTYKGHSRQVSQPGTYCSQCGEASLSPEDIAATSDLMVQQRAEIDRATHL